MLSALVLLGLLGSATAQACPVAGLATLHVTRYVQTDGVTACDNGGSVADGETCSLQCAAGYAATGTAGLCTTGTFAAGTETCANVNECTVNADNNCAAVGGACADLEGTFSCTCSAGYTGSGVVCTENSCVAGSGNPSAIGVVVARDTCEDVDVTGTNAAADASSCNSHGGTGSCAYTCTGTATPSCTGTATDTALTCDLDASTDGTASCPVGCTGTSTCDVDASTDTTADCPVGCTETCGAAVAAGTLTTLTGVGTATCDPSWAGTAAAQCLVPSAAFTYNGCTENACAVDAALMTAAYVVASGLDGIVGNADDDDWYTDAATCSGTATDTNVVCSTTAADAANCGAEAGCILTIPNMVSVMGRLSCAAGYHGVATASCTTSGGAFVFGGCVENECITNSGNPAANFVALLAGNPAATRVSVEECTVVLGTGESAGDTTCTLTAGAGGVGSCAEATGTGTCDYVAGLGAATCMSGYTHNGAAATATCLDHGGVFAFSGCALNQCATNFDLNTPAAANIVAADPAGGRKTVAALGVLSCAAGYHPGCTGTPNDQATHGADCALVDTNAVACPAGCTDTGPSQATACVGTASSPAAFSFLGCIANHCVTPGGGANGGVLTNGVRVSNSAEVIVGLQVATGLGLGAACVRATGDTTTQCADAAAWLAAGTEASCPAPCEFFAACLAQAWDGAANTCTGTATDATATPDCAVAYAAAGAGSAGACAPGCTYAGSMGWTGGDGLAVTTSTCLTHGGAFVFSGCSDVDDCTATTVAGYTNGACGTDALCTNQDGGRECRCLSLDAPGPNNLYDITGTTGFTGHCVIGESYCKVTDYCRVIGTNDGTSATGVGTAVEATCEDALSDAGLNANQWTDNAHTDETACAALATPGVWTACTGHTPGMCFANLPQHCVGAFGDFALCTATVVHTMPDGTTMLDGTIHACEAPSTAVATAIKTYTISAPALNAAQRYNAETGALLGTPASADSCPQLEPTCTGTHTGTGTCEEVFAYASGTTVFDGSGAVLAHTAPEATDCPTTAGCTFVAIAASGIAVNYPVQTACAEYVNKVGRFDSANVALTFTAGHCEIAANDPTGITNADAAVSPSGAPSSVVCANGLYTTYDSANNICIRTIATTQSSCEVYPHPEVTQCGGVAIVSANELATRQACEGVPGCAYNNNGGGAAQTCMPVGTWVPNACYDAAATNDVCSSVSLLTPAATNAAANMLTCTGLAGCAYTPDDTSTTASEETCLIRDEAACEHELLTIQTGQTNVAGKGLFGTDKIDVGDTITTIGGETKKIVSVSGDSMATIDSAWTQATGTTAATTIFSTGAGACPGRVKQNQLDHEMHALSASLLSANTAVRDSVSRAVQSERAANLASAATVATSLSAKVTAMGVEQEDRRLGREAVTTALSNMQTRVLDAHTAATQASTSALAATATRITDAHAAKDTEAGRVHALMAHQLEQHTTGKHIARNLHPQFYSGPPTPTTNLPRDVSERDCVC